MKRINLNIIKYYQNIPYEKRHYLLKNPNTPQEILDKIVIKTNMTKFYIDYCLSKHGNYKTDTRGILSKKINNIDYIEKIVDLQTYLSYIFRSGNKDNIEYSLKNPSLKEGIQENLSSLTRIQTLHSP